LNENLNEILDWEDFASEILTITFNTIKYNGCAFIEDVLQLEFLNIPFFALIAVIKDKERFTVVSELNKRSITFYDIRKAIHMFVDSNYTL
jgi:hypothetical protein